MSELKGRAQKRRSGQRRNDTTAFTASPLVVSTRPWKPGNPTRCVYTRYYLVAAVRAIEVAKTKPERGRKRTRSSAVRPRRTQTSRTSKTAERDAAGTADEVVFSGTHLRTGSDFFLPASQKRQVMVPSVPARLTRVTKADRKTETAARDLKEMSRMVESKLDELIHEQHNSENDDDAHHSTNHIRLAPVQPAEMAVLNEEQKLAFERATSREYARNVLLLGKPGTGKTSVLTLIIRAISQYGRPVVLAPTGMAATNLIHGQTIHSFFRVFRGLEMHPRSASDAVKLLKKNQDVMVDICMKTHLICDELSMINADSLTFMDLVLQEIREDGRVFGGLKVVLCGDLCQLPPITCENGEGGGATAGRRPTVKELSDERARASSSMDVTTPSMTRGAAAGGRQVKRMRRPRFIFQSPSWCKLFSPDDLITLPYVYRQQGDGRFLEILDEIRSEGLGSDSIADLESRIVDARTAFELSCTAEGEKMPVLFCNNPKVNEWNEYQLKRIVQSVYSDGDPSPSTGNPSDDPMRKFPESDDTEWDETYMKTYKREESKYRSNLRRLRDPRHDSQNVEKEIAEFLYRYRHMTMTLEDAQRQLEDDLPDKSPYLHMLPGVRVCLTINIDVKQGLVNRRLGTCMGLDSSGDPLIRWDETGMWPEVTQSVKRYKWCVRFSKGTVFVRQYPLRYAWAMTVHTSQGKTCSNGAIIDCSDVFEDGQGYTALSRVPSLAKLYLIDRIQPSKLTVHPDVIRYLKQFTPIHYTPLVVVQEDSAPPLPSPPPPPPLPSTSPLSHTGDVVTRVPTEDAPVDPPSPYDTRETTALSEENATRSTRSAAPSEQWPWPSWVTAAWANGVAANSVQL